ncbi:hypothetical protein [Streptomyces decoyicus]|uniref:hypothetical protein n=1 Tax=Streptomyces decoyicus TaxID=249567 RepID=UPI00386E0142
MTSTPSSPQYRPRNGSRREGKRTIRLQPEEQSAVARAATQQGVIFAAVSAYSALSAAAEQAGTATPSWPAPS